MAYAATSTVKYSTPGTATDRERLGAASLAAQYGNIDYDRQGIEDVFQKSVDATGAMKQKEYERSANQYYNRQAQSQNAYLGAMRKANAQAVSSGAARGMQSANELSALLGISQQTSLDNTTLAQDQRGLIDKLAADKAAATQKALEYANATKMGLGTLDANLYATDAQKYAAELGAKSQVDSANTAASAQEVAAQQARSGQEYTADQNLSGTQYTSDRNLEGVQYNANQNLAGTRYSAEQNRAGQEAYAGAYSSAAQTQAAASRYAANQNLAGNFATAAGGITQQAISSLSTLASNTENVNDPVYRQALINIQNLLSDEDVVAPSVSPAANAGGGTALPPQLRTQ